MGEQAVQRKKTEVQIWGGDSARRKTFCVFFFIPTLGRRERGVWGGGCESWVFSFVCLFVFYIDYFIN